eukprot:3027271-Prymnesium_polylepis.1
MCETQPLTTDNAHISRCDLCVSGRSNIITSICRLLHAAIARATQLLVRCGCAFSAQRRGWAACVARSASSWEDAFGA